MVLSRLLMILFPPLDAQGAAATVRRALESAARPLALRFALPASLRSAAELAPQADLLFYDDEKGLEGVPALLTDEASFLCLMGSHAFTPKWDSALLRMQKELGRRVLLTGSLTAGSCPQSAAPAFIENAPTLRLSLAALREAMPELQKRRQSPVPSAQSEKRAEVCLPALRNLPDQANHMSIVRGLPLVCAKEPVKTLLIDPALLFGPVSFLREATLAPDTLSLAAYLTGYPVYVLPQPVLFPLSDPPPRLLSRPAPEALPGTTLARFEQLLGFRFGQRKAIGKTAMGLFGAEDTYAQRMPVSTVLSQKARAARLKWQERCMPLMVSAFIDLPSAVHSPAFYQLRFGFLRRIESLPLVLYTGGEQERALRAAFPNTHSYPAQHLLPRSLMAEGSMQPQEHFARSKPLLMLRAAKRQLEFSHIAWVDMDLLPHPICPDAVPDLEGLMDDRIHIATVNGVPDASFLVVPAELLPRVAKTVLSITHLDAELKRGCSEALLWERMYAMHPEWFAIHPMPARRLLFLSAFDRTLLSQSLQTLLSDLPKAEYGVPSAPPRKEISHGSNTSR